MTEQECFYCGSTHLRRNWVIVNDVLRKGGYYTKLNKCRCGNAMRDGKTWCDPCYSELTKKWDKEIQEYLHLREHDMELS